MGTTSSPGTLHPELESLAGQMSAVRADAEKLCGGLTNAQFNWRPAPEKWSIAQCISHLNVVDGRDLPAVEQAIATARQSGMLLHPGPYRYGWLSSWFVRKMEPPASMKFRAPDIYVPPPEQDIHVALGEFLRVQDRLQELLVAADGLDLVRIKVPSPVVSFIKFSLGQRLRLIAAHDRRHLYQAWEVRRALP